MAARSAAALKKAASSGSPAETPKLDAGSLGHVDQLIHERIRLGILSALIVNESLTFNELRDSLATTDGNLSVHARKLEDAGYVVCRKLFSQRIPKTEYRLTPTGRKMFDKYLNHMESLIQAMRGHTGEK